MKYLSRMIKAWLTLGWEQGTEDDLLMSLMTVFKNLWLILCGKHIRITLKVEQELGYWHTSAKDTNFGTFFGVPSVYEH